MLRTFTVTLLIGASFARTLPTAKDGTKNGEKNEQLYVSLPYWLGNLNSESNPFANAQKHNEIHSIVERAENKGNSENTTMDNHTTKYLVHIGMLLSNRVLPIFGFVSTREVSGPIGEAEAEKQDLLHGELIEDKQEVKVSPGAHVEKENSNQQIAEAVIVSDPDANHDLPGRGAQDEKKQHSSEANFSNHDEENEVDHRSSNSGGDKHQEHHKHEDSQPKSKVSLPSNEAQDPKVKNAEEPTTVKTQNEETQSEPNTDVPKDNMNLNDGLTVDPPKQNGKGETSNYDQYNEEVESSTPAVSSRPINMRPAEVDIQEEIVNPDIEEAQAESSTSLWGTITKFFSNLWSFITNRQPRSVTTTTEASLSSITISESSKN